ncbi:MAG: Fic family protein [bacterium]
MPYIYEDRDWPNFKWDDALLAPALVEIRHRQGRLLGRMEALGFHLRDEAHLATLTVDIVKSAAIEGESLDAGEVRSSLARKLGMETGGTPLSSRHIEGVVEMMLDATQKYAEPLTQERLFSWHAALFPTGYSNMRKITVGAWRTMESGPMQVVSGGIGREKVHFEAPAALRLDAEVNAFLQWFNAPPAVDPVLKAALAHFWFVTIHPFEDGNGRIARAIADMALARADGTATRFYSMSAQIEAERKDYYQILESSQKGTIEITLWMKWFLECLGRALELAHTTLAGVLRKARIWEKINMSAINDRQRLVVNRLLDGFEGNLTSSKYAKLAHCSADTALRDIRELLERGTLMLNPSRGRSTSYRLSE